MIPITWYNIDTIKPGVKVFFDGRYATLIEDSRYTGGQRVGGMSLHHILENYTNVFYMN